MSHHLETLETIYRILWRENRLEDALRDLPDELRMACARAAGRGARAMAPMR